MSGETALVNLVVGLLKRSRTPRKEIVFRLMQKDVNIFNIVRNRVVKTQQRLILRSLSGKCIEFDQHVIAFTYALAAANKYISTDVAASKFYAVYLTFEKSVESTPYFRLTVKQVKTDKAIMECVLQGLL